MTDNTWTIIEAMEEGDIYITKQGVKYIKQGTEINFHYDSMLDSHDYGYGVMDVATLSNGTSLVIKTPAFPFNMNDAL